MTRNVMIMLSAAVLAIAPLAPAFPQSAVQQNMQMNSAGTALSAIAKKPGQPAADAGPSQPAGFSQLTEQECRNLGGAVHTAPQCKKTQQRCVIRLAGGQINAPCIDEVAK